MVRTVPQGGAGSSPGGEATFVGINVRGTTTQQRAPSSGGSRFPTTASFPTTVTRRFPAFGGALATAAVPSTVVVDREGRVAARVVGIVTFRALMALVDEVLAER